MELVSKWLGWLDSNQRMRESKSRALPLGYTPVLRLGKTGEEQGIERQALNPLSKNWGG